MGMAPPAEVACFYDVLLGNVSNLVCLIYARKGVAGAELNSNWRGLDCAYRSTFGCGSIQRRQVPSAIVWNRISLKTTGFTLLKGNVFAGACPVIPIKEKCYPGVYPADLELVVNTNNVTCGTKYCWVRNDSQNNEDTHNVFCSLATVNHRFIRFSTKPSTTAGSARVEVSPKLLCSFAAILRRIRRMIFPERVLGSPGDH